jgi:hypothetical protein
VTLRIIKIEDDTHRIGLSMRRVDSPAYTDLDWKTLTEEFDVDELSSEDVEEQETEESSEAEPTAETEEETETKAEAQEEAEAEADAEAETEAEEPEEE